MRVRTRNYTILIFRRAFFILLTTLALWVLVTLAFCFGGPH
jgi:hypothetical protein